MRNNIKYNIIHSLHYMPSDFLNLHTLVKKFPVFRSIEPYYSLLHRRLRERQYGPVRDLLIYIFLAHNIILLCHKYETKHFLKLKLIGIKY